MNDVLRVIILNIGKITGALAGLLIALFLVCFGLFKTLFIAGLVVLGFILGKWYDEGVSFGKIASDIVRAIRVRK